MKEKQKIGRPTKRTDEKIDRVISAVSRGTPLAVVCREFDFDVDIFGLWRKTDADLERRYRIARDLGFDAIAAEALMIADSGDKDAGSTQRDKLRVETRLKLLAKWDPKRYGDRIHNEVSGPDGGPIETRNLTDEARSRRIEELLAKRAKR